MINHGSHPAFDGSAERNIECIKNKKIVMTPKRKGHLDPLKSQLNVRSDIHGQNL